jgi:AcrR family transcriptional regulator
MARVFLNGVKVSSVGLTRQQIVQAALDVLDEGGLEAVTTRSVATRLGVKAPALYWHVAGKQALLDEMGTEIQRRIMARVRPVDDRTAWTEQLRSYAHAVRSEYLVHKDGARAFSGTRLTDPSVLQAQEPLLAAWVERGLALHTAISAAELVTAFVVGFVIEEQERAQSAPDRYDLDARTAAIGTDHPLVALAGQLLAADPDQRFDAHLDVILTGIAATQSQTPGYAAS